MTFTDEDVAYVARRLETLGDVNVDACDFRNALRATLPLPSERFVAFWGLELRLDTMDFVDGYGGFAASFAARSNFLDFVAGCLATKLQVCRMAAEE